MKKTRQGIITRGIIIIAAFFVFIFSGTNQAKAIDLTAGTWQLFSIPGSTWTLATGIDGNKVVGYYLDSDIHAHAFTYDGTTFTTSSQDVPGAVTTMPSGVYGSSVIGVFNNTGSFNPWENIPYWFNGTSWIQLQNYAPTGSVHITPTGVYEDKVVGWYFDPNYTHGFLFNGSTWVTIDTPAAYGTMLWGINQNKLLGVYFDGTGSHVFIDDGTTRSVLNIPFLGYNLASNDNYVVSSELYNYPDGWSNVRGYLYDIAAQSTTMLDAPEPCVGFCTHVSTNLTGISGNKVVGYTVDGVKEYGFIYTIPTVLSFLPDYPNGLNTTTFNYPDKPLFKAVYTDANGGTNGSVNVVVDGVSYPMTKSLDLINPYYFWSPDNSLAAGTHSYHFETYDGVRLVRMPEMGELGFEMTATAPTLSDLGQFKLDGNTPIPVGASTTESGVVLRGTPSSVSGDQVQMQIEIQQADEPFTGLPSSTSAFVVSGQTVAIRFNGLSNNDYHWQARAVDAQGNVSDWEEFDSSRVTNFFVIAFDPYPNGYSFGNPFTMRLTDSNKIDILNSVFSNVGSITTGTLNAILNNERFAFGEYGNCVGMLLTAAKQFRKESNYLLNGDQTLYDVAAPAISGAGKWEVNNFSLNSTLGHILENQAVILATTTGQSNIGDGLVDVLLSNNPIDFLLMVFHVNQQGQSEGHVVLPYRIEKVVSGQNYKVYIYDPNTPGDKDRYVTLVKQASGGWDRIMTVNGVTWQSSDRFGTFLAPIVNYNFEKERLQISATVIAKNTTKAIVQSVDGLTSGFDSNQVIQDIPDITLNLPVGLASYGTSTSEYWFRGNLNQNLTFHLKPDQAGSDDEKMSLLKWAPTGYVQANFNSKVDQPQVYINADNTQVTIASTTGSFTLSIDNASNGQDNIVSISATSTSASSSNTYLVDWDAVAAGQDGVALQINPGDGTPTHTVHVGSNFSDTTAPTTTPIISGTPGKNNWYSSNVIISLNAVDNDGGVGVEKIKYSLNNDIWQDYVSTSPITISTEDVHTLQFYAVDYFGNQEATNTISLSIDKTPPSISMSTIPTSTILGAPISLSHSATDTLSGIATITSAIDGQQISNNATVSNLTPGNHIYQVTATDNAGNTATSQESFSVIYNFSGFLSPIKSDGSGLYNLGRTLPIKFTLTDTDNNPITSATAHLVITNVQNGIIGTDPINLDTTVNDTGSYFRVSDNQYIYNLATSQLTSGTWQLKVLLDDGRSYAVLVSFR